MKLLPFRALEQLMVQVSAEDVEERMNALEENIKNLKPNLNAIEVGHPNQTECSNKWELRDHGY